MWGFWFTAPPSCAPLKFRSTPAHELLREARDAVAPAHTNALQLVRLTRHGEPFDGRRRAEEAGTANRGDHARVVPPARIAEEVHGHAEHPAKRLARSGHLALELPVADRREVGMR